MGVLDKGHRSRAAAGSFQSERPRAGEQVQHGRADDAIAETGKDGLADAVRRRPRVAAARRDQRHSTGDTGNDPHELLDQFLKLGFEKLLGCALDQAFR